LLAGTDPNDYPGAVVTPTATPPCFEAVFANFLLRKPGKFTKNTSFFSKAFFLKKGLCLDAEGTLNRKVAKANKNTKKVWGICFFIPPLFIFNI